MRAEQRGERPRPLALDERTDRREQPPVYPPVLGIGVLLPSPARGDGTPDILPLGEWREPFLFPRRANIDYKVLGW